MKRYTTELWRSPEGYAVKARARLSDLTLRATSQRASPRIALLLLFHRPKYQITSSSRDLITPELGIVPRYSIEPDSDRRNMTDDEPSLNIPSLLTLAVVSYFVLRWFLNRDDNSAAGGRGRGRGNVVDPASVAQIAQMFPQMNTRDIMWDLQRNGGSVPATTERILTGRGLETVCLNAPTSVYLTTEVARIPSL